MIKQHAINQEIEQIGHPHDHNFRQQVKGGGWLKIKPAIRKRFDAMAMGQIFDYSGQLVVHRSGIGALFACVCKLFGAPLVIHKDENAHVDVRVFEQKDGICWARTFHFANKPSLTVSSVKIIDKKHGIMERVGGGLHMKLDVYEEDGDMHFVSDKYYIKVFNQFIPLPMLFTPGRLHVAHLEEGNDTFRFTMSFKHKLWGETFFQDGVFRSKGE